MVQDAEYKKRRQLKEARLEIVASLYKQGHTVRSIQADVKERLGIPTYSTATVMHDINTLLAEWRKSRVEQTDFAVQLELERIDDACRELWAQWEKSKTNYVKTEKKRRGRPAKGRKDDSRDIETYQREEKETEVIRLGDPAYISEIRQQLAERRRLLGMYAPEKREITGKDGKDLITEMSYEDIQAEIARIRDIRDDK